MVTWLALTAPWAHACPLPQPDSDLTGVEGGPRRRWCVKSPRCWEYAAGAENVDLSLPPGSLLYQLRSRGRVHVGTSWVCRSSGFLEGHNPTAGTGSWVPSSLWRQFRGAQGTWVSAGIALGWRQSWKLEKTCLQGWAVLRPNSGGERRGPGGSKHSEYGGAP